MDTRSRGETRVIGEAQRRVSVKARKRERANREKAEKVKTQVDQSDSENNAKLNR